MERLWQYSARYQGVRSGVSRLPAWARTILLIVASPAIAAALLSLLAFLVSLLALLLLTVPLYRLLQGVTGVRPAVVAPPDESFGLFGGLADGLSSPGRKRVDVTVVEPAGRAPNPDATPGGEPRMTKAE